MPARTKRTKHAATHTDDTTRQFVHQLRELRRSCGNPSYAELAKRTGHGRSTLNEALRGIRLPSLDLTMALARACGDDEQLWRHRWLEASRPPMPAPAPGGDTAAPSRAQQPEPPSESKPEPLSAWAHSSIPQPETLSEKGPESTPEPETLSAARKEPVSGSGRALWWRRLAGTRLSLPAVAGVVVLGAVVAAGTTWLVDGGGQCATIRGYRIGAPGAILDQHGAVIGDVRAGDQAVAETVVDRTFSHRRLATVTRTGQTGYVDEAKLVFTGNVCR